MSRFNSQVLRQLAEEILNEIGGQFDVPEPDRRDFVTALVRQWISYDGSATLFVGDQQLYLQLEITPLGNYRVSLSPDSKGWNQRILDDWNISPDDLPDVLAQLNRGQSAEVINQEGIPVRLWVNPKERSRGVEP